MGMRVAEREEKGEEAAVGRGSKRKGDEVGERASECRICEAEKKRGEERRGD